MPKKPTTHKETESKVVVSAEKAAGAAAGKVAAPPSAPAEARPATKSLKVGKLPKKQRHRLPRRQKKAQQKKAASHPFLGE
jgi:hypothetical protein